MLFAEPHEAELIWPGKTAEVTNVVVPFQSIEQVDEPRAETSGQVADLFAFDAQTGQQSSGWTNKLIWGDNKLVISSLKTGQLRREIEKAGSFKLAYIDPPFDVGTDFSFDIEIGGEAVTKEPSVIEDIAYRDTWGRGADSYIDMLYQRFRLLHDLMASDASLYVHCDGRVNSYVRLALDEVLGKEQIANEITWKRTGARSGSRQYNIITERILFYKKGIPIFVTQYTPYTREYMDQYFEKDDEGRFFQSVTLTAPERRTGSSGMPWRGKIQLQREDIGRFPASSDQNYRIQKRKTFRLHSMNWMQSDEFCGRRMLVASHASSNSDILPLFANSLERVGYETQRPESLLAVC